MKTISTQTAITIHGHQDRALLDQQTDALAEELLAMEAAPGCVGLRDSSVSTDFANFMIEVELTVEHHGFEEGTALAESCLNRALTRVLGEPNRSREKTAQRADLVLA